MVNDQNLKNRNLQLGMQASVSGLRQHGPSGAAGLEPLCRWAAVMPSGSACSRSLKLEPPGALTFDIVNQGFKDP